MLFSCKKFIYSLRRVVRPMLIKVLVAALVKGFKDTFNLIDEGREKVVLDNKLLKGNREAYM
jgi:hypothetical protein